MFRYKSLFVIIALAVSVLASCNPDDTVSPPVIITSIKDNIQPDSTDGWLYYSFDTDATIPTSQAGTDAWDIRFRFISSYLAPLQFADVFQIAGPIYLNSPTAGNAAGKTKGYVADTAFSLITAAGDDSKFRSDDTTLDARIISRQLGGPTAFFIYSGPPSHTVSPNPQKTLIIRTAKGKYVKMQLQSIYKGKPLVPAMTDPVGYYSFQYVKSDTKSFK